MALLTPLESRKRLLVATAEVQRLQWCEDFSRMRHAGHDLAAGAREKARFASTFLPLIGVAVTAVAALRSRGPSRRKGAKDEPGRGPSLLERMLPLARTGLTLWLALRRG